MNRDKACLEDIIQSMRSVVVYVGTLTVDEFIKNQLVIHAVERCLEIIGEATKRLSMPLHATQRRSTPNSLAQDGRAA